jgi:vacuolar iron transporter family protein
VSSPLPQFAPGEHEQEQEREWERERDQEQEQEQEQQQIDHHLRRDPHVRGRWLSDVVLGAQDGIVNTLGVLLGVSSASSDQRVIVATGMAAAVAESISMAAVAYTSSIARGDLYRAERDREYRHIERAPLVEREEIRALFKAKGFEGELLERAVETVCSRRDTWVAMMMSEEHGLTSIDSREAMRSALVVGGASLVASILPVVPFALISNLRAANVGAMILGGMLLATLGVFKARITTRKYLRSGFSLVVIGLASALAGYIVGAVFSGAATQ